MTVFVEIMKEIFKDRIYSIKDSSIKNDKGWINWAATQFNYGRNLHLSKDKRDRIDTLNSAIENFSAAKNDAESYKNLSQLIDNCREKIKELAEKNNKGEGESGANLIKANTILKDIYTEFEKYGLLDIEHDEDPYSVFRFHMAKFLAAKIVEEHKGSNPKTLFGKIIGNDQLTRIKRELVRNKLRECTQDIPPRPKTNTPDPDRERIVLNAIKLLNFEHEELLKKHGIPIKVPLPISFIPSEIKLALGSIEPDPGNLGDSIVRAVAEIKKIDVNKMEEGSVKSLNNTSLLSPTN